MQYYKKGKKMKNLIWQLRLESETTHLKKGTTFPASVPGDITIDLFKAGYIADPYFGLNHKDLGWIAEQDFTYFTQFDLDEETLKNEDILLTFDSVDLFSDVYLNGQKVGITENAFLQYSFHIKDLAKKKGNLLEVKMHSTIQKMHTFDCSGYKGVFNVERILLRKPQCHFGWDWAPDLCAYGICGDVEIKGESQYKIENVWVRPFNTGYVTLLAELNYNVRSLLDFMGVAIDNTAAKKDNDTLRFSVEKTPGSGEYITQDLEVTGKKNFVNLKVENPQLWWPQGYGAHPLYAYKVELLRGEKVVYSLGGKFGFREVKLLEEPKSSTTLGYELSINGQKVFAKGSNWVPAECFTGCMTDEKYEKLVHLAVSGNLNMLRVWGGGLYERDTFYNLCDENGIMVWQDFMYACSDIPEDNEAWVQNTLKECEYQIKRLRNHPALVYWCGGNEKTGAYGLQISKGDFFIDNILAGLVHTLDPFRPFARQSPCSITDVGNDLTSGESHYNSFEASLSSYTKTGATMIANYRKLVSEKSVSFASECAILGPNSEETDKKIYPEDKLWPLNEIWADRMMDNPYAGVVMPFYKRQQLYIRDMYGEAKNLTDFTAKGMAIQAETLRAEIEFARSNKDITGGIMNWMYSDIWPSGTWAVIDYYLEPKESYYQIKRSFAPLLITFTENNKGETLLVVANDTQQEFLGDIEFGKKSLDGKIIDTQKINVHLEEGGLYKTPVPFKAEGENTYLYAKCGDYKNLYSPDFWRTCDFKADYEIKTEKLSAHKIKVNIAAKTFVKGLFLSFKDNYKYLYFDNYIDIEAGDKISIIIESEEEIDEKALKAASFDEMTK